MKLLIALVIFIIGISILFPEKSLEIRDKLIDTYHNLIGVASSTINKTNEFASSTLNEQIKNLASSTEIQNKVLEGAQKILYGTPLKAKGGQVPVAEVVLTDSGVVSFTNQARIKASLKSLTVNIKLNEAASLKAKDLFAKQYFDHISPSGDGPDKIVKQSGYEYIVIGENLAMGNFKNDEELLVAWLASPGHRANILNTRFTEVGTAVLRGYYENKEVWMAVQEFGLPLSSCQSPDLKIKTEIDNSDNLMKDLSAELVRLKGEIVNTPRENPDYNKKIDDYNSRIASYNELLQSTKLLIEKYNTQVKTFNICLQGP